MRAPRLHSILTIPLMFGGSLCISAQTTITPTAGSGDLNTTINQSGNTSNINGGTRFEKGSNLFHSFDEFSVGSGDIANFNNDTGLPTENILSRVTGGNRSDIFGTIQTTGFDGTNLYLLNPAGLLFGNGASVNVEGSFYVSTSDFVQFRNGARLNATASPIGPRLGVAPPEAFGFLSDNPGAIEIDLPFFAQAGESLSFVGGSIDINGGFFDAESGPVNIVSADSGGTAVINDGNVKLDEQTPRSAITIQNSQITSNAILPGLGVNIQGGNIKITDTTIRTPVDFAADIAIGATDTVELNGARLLTDNNEQSGNVSISAGREVVLNRSFDGMGQDTLIQTSTDSGKAGDVSIVSEGDLKIMNSRVDPEASSGTPGAINLKAKGLLALGEGTEIFSRAVDSLAPAVTIAAGVVNMSDGAKIQGQTEGKGRGANVDITATEAVTLEGQDTTITTASSVEEQATGPGGNVTINTPHLAVREGAEISARTSGPGQGGNVNINAIGGKVTIEGVGSKDTPSAITTDSVANASNGGVAGNAGSIMIKAGQFVVQDGGEVSASTATTGTGGNLQIESPDIRLNSGGQISTASSGTGFDTTNNSNTGRAGSVTIDGRGGTVSLSGQSTSITSETTGDGDAGEVVVTRGGRLTIRDRAEISASTRGNGMGGNVDIHASNIDLINGGQISASVSETGTGTGGNVDIRASNIDLINGGQISARSDSNDQKAKSGNVTIRFDDTFRIFNESSVNVETKVANAGDIEINTKPDSPKGFLLHLRDKSSISTSSRDDGEGRGGNITIDPVFVVLDGGSDIIANARDGIAGDINITTTSALFKSSNSKIQASNDLDLTGNIEINSPDSDVIAGTLTLPESFISASTLLGNRCAARAAKKSSSFVVGGRGGVPVAPDAVFSGPISDLGCP